MAVIIQSLLLLLATENFSQASKSLGKRFIDHQKYSSDERIKTLVNNNNGIRVPPGYHSYSAVFMKKPSFDKNYDKPFTDTPIDFSLSGPFFASGTILNRRWTLTRATRIAYYSPDGYWMISQQSIPSPMDEHFLKKHEVDFVLIHPEHEPGNQETDAALVRTSRPIEFDVERRSANLGFDNPAPLEACKVVVWSWFFEKDNMKVASMDRGELEFDVKKEDCSNLSDNFVCLSESDAKHQPCGINSGAPVVCGSVLVGIYAGKGTGAICEIPPSKGFPALRIDKGKMRDWLIDVLASPDTILDPEDHDELVLKTCSANHTIGYHLVLLILLLKYII